MTNRTRDYMRVAPHFSSFIVLATGMLLALYIYPRRLERSPMLGSLRKRNGNSLVWWGALDGLV